MLSAASMYYQCPVKVVYHPHDHHSWQYQVGCGSNLLGSYELQWLVKHVYLCDHYVSLLPIRTMCGQLLRCTLSLAHYKTVWTELLQ